MYHSGSPLVLILHERVHLLLQNFQNLDLRPLNGGMFSRLKKDEHHFNFFVPSVCTHYTGCIKYVCFIQEVPSYWYSKNESVPPQNAQNLALKPLNGGTLDCKKEWTPLQLWLPRVCTHWMGCIRRVCIIQEVPWYWYSTNESVYQPRTHKNFLWNR